MWRSSAGCSCSSWSILWPLDEGPVTSDRASAADCRAPPHSVAITTMGVMAVAMVGSSISSQLGNLDVADIAGAFSVSADQPSLGNIGRSSGDASNRLGLAVQVAPSRRGRAAAGPRRDDIGRAGRCSDCQKTTGRSSHRLPAGPTTNSCYGRAPRTRYSSIPGRSRSR